MKKGIIITCVLVFLVSYGLTKQSETSKAAALYPAPTIDDSTAKDPFKDIPTTPPTVAPVNAYPTPEDNSQSYDTNSYASPTPEEYYYSTPRYQYAEPTPTPFVSSNNVKSATNEYYSCNSYGNTTNCSSGTDSFRLTTNGNYTYDNNGNSYHNIGNTTYSSDGSSATSIGNTSYGSDGTNCTRIGNSIDCN